MINYSTLSTLTTTEMKMRKRPRTQSLWLDLPSTSALTTIAKPTEKMMSANELIATRNPIDDALAELDVSLGLGCPSSFTLPTPCMSIEEELDAAFEAVRKQRQRERVVPLYSLPDDASCISGSGRYTGSVSVKTEDSSAPVDVLHELQALDSRTSITVMSPPLSKSCYKRRRR